MEKIQEISKCLNKEDDFMKIILHGSIFTDNFGDVLFADLFYSRLKKNGNEVFFFENKIFGISDFAREEIGYTGKCRLRDLLNADALVMLSGGYLGEDRFSFKNTLTRFIKYVIPVRILQILGKKTYFIGVGGGPIHSSFLRRITVKALNKAKYISVRDQETYQYFIEYGVKNNMSITSDTAQSISMDYCKESHVFISSEHIKYVFLHFVNNESFDKNFSVKIVPALNRFLTDHKEYSVIVGTDVRVDEDTILNSKTYKAIVSPNKKIYLYCSVKQLCDVLSKVDFVITPKLHVGIVASTFGKSVLSFPIHREKTGRYYKQIGESDRSIKLFDVSENVAYSQIKKFYGTPIRLSDNITQLAKSNLEFLDCFVGVDMIHERL